MSDSSAPRMADVALGIEELAKFLEDKLGLGLNPFQIALLAMSWRDGLRCKLQPNVLSLDQTRVRTLELLLAADQSKLGRTFQLLDSEGRLAEQETEKLNLHLAGHSRRPLPRRFHGAVRR